MKYKYPLIIISCVLTILNQVIYHYTPGADSLTYLKLARQYSEFYFYDPTLNCYGHAFYALFLAVTGTISNHHFVVGFIQTLVFSMSALLLIRELEIYLNKNLFGLAVLLFLVPEIHLFNGHVLTESFGFSFIMLVFAQALRIYQRGASVSNMLLLSFLLGITTVNRVEWVICIIPAVFLIYPKIKSRFLFYSLIAISVPIFLLALNGARNYKIYSVFKLTGFNGGEVIYGGNNENLDGSHHVFHEHAQVFIPKDRIEDLNNIISMPPKYAYPKRDSFYLHLAIDAWKNAPLKQVGVIPQKFAKNWLLPGTFDIYTADTTKTRGLQVGKLLSKTYFNNPIAPYKHLFYMVIHWVLLILVVTGIITMDRQNRFQKAVMILLGFSLLYTIPFCGLPRWHVAVFPILIIAFTPASVLNRLNKILGRLLKEKLR